MTSLSPSEDAVPNPARKRQEREAAFPHSREDPDLSSESSVVDVGAPPEVVPVASPAAPGRSEPAGQGPSPGRGGELYGDPIHMYLREIGSVPLLTLDEEAELAAAIQEGQAAAKRLTRGVTEENERRKLALSMQEGRLAERTLVQANLRLVVSVAKRFLTSGLAFSDLVQEGNLGLLRATRKFDPRRGYKFSTYATWWIRQAISRYIVDHARTIRVPAHMAESIAKLHRAQRKWIQETGEAPSLEELACEMGLLTEEDVAAVAQARRMGTAVDPEVKQKWRRAILKVRHILRASQEPISLEIPVGAEQEGSLADLIEDESTLAPMDQASRQLLKEQVEDALEELTERERKVLELRFGLLDGQPQTLEEVGSAFGVTRERIRQIESKALRKLRHPHYRRKLKDFL